MQVENRSCAGPGRWSAGLVGGLCCLVLAACGGSSLRPSDLPDQVDSSSSSSGEYVIGPGDTLEVFVWRQPDLTVTVPVRPDGMISTPLVEDVVAVGKSPSELAREVEEALSEYIRSPQVNIIVQDFVGTFGEQIRVIGQAGEPAAIPFRERMTLLDVMVEVGGLTEFAAGNRGRVVRNVEGEPQEIRVRLDDLVNNGDISENIRMQPGDIVIIPEARF